LKALGLTPKERRAVTTFYALGHSRRRSMAEIATELKMSERGVSTLIRAIRENMPELRYPFAG
jgi:DNA-binding CsgD family transcriptional regulator